MRESFLLIILLAVGTAPPSQALPFELLAAPDFHAQATRLCSDVGGDIVLLCLRSKRYLYVYWANGEREQESGSYETDAGPDQTAQIRFPEHSRVRLMGTGSLKATRTAQALVFSFQSRGIRRTVAFESTACQPVSTSRSADPCR